MLNYKFALNRSFDPTVTEVFYFKCIVVSPDFSALRSRFYQKTLTLKSSAWLPYCSKGYYTSVTISDALQWH